MNSYSIYVEFDVKNPKAATIAELAAHLEPQGWSAACGTSPHGLLDVLATVPADAIPFALQNLLTVASMLPNGRNPVHVEVLTETEFDRRQGFEVTEVPDMASVTDAAATLGVSRQRVLQMLGERAFPSATKVGTTWVIPTADLTRLAIRPYLARQDPATHYEGALPQD